MTTETSNLDLLLDVKVRLTVRLGHCQMTMRNVMELNTGAVIQLDQKATDPVCLYVNDRLVAYGEVVLVEDNFGIKITKIAEPQG